MIVYLAVGRLAVGLEYYLTPGLLIKLACLAVFFATLCIVKWAPAEVPYRPINGKQEKVLFKALSLLYLAVWLFLLIYFINLLSNSLWMAAVLSLLVQVFSFTPPGYKFITWIDGLMIKLKIGGELDCG